MPLTYTYHDKYLAPLVAAEVETRAAADVATLGTFPAEWVERLTVVRSYVLTCMESQKAPDDLFTAKLAIYRKEFDALLPQARAAAQVAADAASGTAPSGGSSWASVELTRS
jgi:hypothetical protein